SWPCGGRDGLASRDGPPRLEQPWHTGLPTPAVELQTHYAFPVACNSLATVQGCPRLARQLCPRRAPRKLPPRRDSRGAYLLQRLDRRRLAQPIARCNRPLQPLQQPLDSAAKLQGSVLAFRRMAQGRFRLFPEPLQLHLGLRAFLETFAVQDGDQPGDLHGL